MAKLPHDFVVVIPCADRPRQITSCLESLQELLDRFPYSGKITTLIAEDSLKPENIEFHRALAGNFTQRGLDTHYLGQDEQRALVEGLPPKLRQRLVGVIGDGQNFSRKGASITRNIASLWLKRLQQDGKKRLFWFVDNDHEFRVDYRHAGEAQSAGLVDYFHWLDRIFNETPTCALSGKITGDPPVSPAVMAVKLLDDVSAFIEEMAGLSPDAFCSFHDQHTVKADAAYHDMADLFGFRHAADAWRYRCPLHCDHDHAACFAAFASRLNRFFDGEHPTRQVFYEACDVMASIKPARTIYTGNYVIDAERLDYFIPFAALKLRMAGPTLGRIMEAELGSRFVTANLPMLHKRTEAASGQSEYRAGIERNSKGVDLSGEFERQYFGDVMLFAIEKLTCLGYPPDSVDGSTITQTVAETESEMHARYRANQARILEKTIRLHALFLDPKKAWWLQPEHAKACSDFTRFLKDMQANFSDDSPAWRMVGSAEHRQARLQAIGEAIRQYRNDREAWKEVLE